jgi:hypothetical protein
MNRTMSRIPLLVSTMALVATSVGGCVYSEKERVIQAPPPPPTTVVAQDRVVTYPEGRWTLYGDGTSASPHYWVWVPAGTTTPPPPPPLPRR